MGKEKVLLVLTVTLALCLMSGCDSTTSVTPEQFVSQLVSDAQNGSEPQAYAGSTLTKASTLQGGGVFIVYSSDTKQYVAVNIVTAEYMGDTAQQMVQQFIADDQALAGKGSNPYDNVAGTLVAPDAQQPGLWIDGSSNLYSVAQQTKDVDLQRAQIQQTSYLQRAANVSVHYQMSFSSALQITLLADKINTSTEQALTEQDRQAVTQSVLKIAGLTSDQFTQAENASIGGSDTLANNLVARAAQNLGMSSDSILRDQILPSLGVDLSK